MFRKILKNLKLRFHNVSKYHSRRNLSELFLDALVRHDVKHSQHVLNIGAGGQIAEVLEHAGVTFTSADIDPAMNPDIVMDIMDMDPISDASMDVIICMEVLEHVQNPFVAIGEMKRVLKEGGLIIGSTPFILSQHSHPNDYFRYTLFGLRLLFQDFEEVELVARNTYLQSVTALIMRLYASATKSAKGVLILLSPPLLAAVGILTAVNRFVKCDDATTGYFFVWRVRRKADQN